MKCQLFFQASTESTRGQLPISVYLFSQDSLLYSVIIMKGLVEKSSSEFWGAFHSTKNFRNSAWYIKWNSPFWFGPTRIFGPLWPVQLSRLVGLKCPFPFDKIFVPSTALLYPARKNNDLRHGGLGQFCATQCTVPLGTCNFRHFKLEYLLNESAPYLLLSSSVSLSCMCVWINGRLAIKSLGPYPIHLLYYVLCQWLFYIQIYPFHSFWSFLLYF